MISLIVPCHDEELVLGDLLDSLAAQNDLPEPHGIEVIVAANGCTDGTIRAITMECR